MADRPNLMRRAWRAIRDFVSALFGPDPAADDRIARQGQVHPRQEQQGRTFQGGING